MLSPKGSLAILLTEPAGKMNYMTNSTENNAKRKKLKTKLHVSNMIKASDS